MGSKLYVGNLSFETTEDDLRAAFSADDRTVKEIAIPLDRQSGKPRGFAFVELSSDEEAQAAMKALDGTDLGGREIKVNEARERTSRPGGGRSGGDRGSW